MSDEPDASAESAAGVWLYAFEEDTPDRMVFRRQAGPLPLARGRERLVLKPDGTLEGARPGPDDRPLPVSGRWRQGAAGEIEVELQDADSAPARRFRREGADRLVTDR
jgi:hypothetical protein